MMRVSTIVLLIALCSSACAQQQQTSQAVSVPEFVDDTRQFVAASMREPLQEYVWANNYKALDTVFKLDWATVRPEMVRRVSDESYPRRLRNLAAAVLMVRNDDAGRSFFMRQFENLAVENVDVYWIVGWYGRLGSRETAEFPDMKWAEALMIAALQDKRTLSRNEVYRANYYENKLVEVREIAVEIGHFQEILANMKSEKALPVMLSLVDENPASYVNQIIAELGKFGDRSVEPLILQILDRRDSRFGSAISAAVDLKMKSVVPILLQRLHRDDNTYYGLNELADASILPVLRQKLPSLKSYERASAQLLILKLQREDPVPALLTLLRDQKFLLRSDVVFRLEELKDRRAVKDLIYVLCTDNDSPMRAFALHALATIRTPDALEGLVKGLDADYTNVIRMKVSHDHDFKKEFQERILEELKQITGKNFGTNTNQWRQWLAAKRNTMSN